MWHMISLMPLVSSSGLAPTRMMTFLSLTALVCLLFAQSVSAETNLQIKERKIINEIFDPLKYDKRIRPAGTNKTDGPVVVTINTMVRSINQISDHKQELSLQLTFREQWIDDRLAFKSDGIDVLTISDVSMIWIPDLFFKNDIDGHFHTMMTPNHYLRIYPDGNVLYSSRIFLTLSCPMNFKLFPFDRQTCKLMMASYGWKTDDVVYLWKEADPVQVTKNLHMPLFVLDKVRTDYCHSRTSTGSYSCLNAELIFDRQFSYYLIFCFIPCCMLVIVSWLSFWLDQNAVTARVVLGVATLMTLVLEVSRINQSVPIVSYTKAIDNYTGICLTFVFCALVELALVNYFLHSDQDQEKKEKDQVNHSVTDGVVLAEPLEESNTAIPMNTLGAKTEGTGSEEDKGKTISSQMKNFYKTWLTKYPTRSKRIDAFSRILFPVVFALFLFIYCCSYSYPD